MTRTSYLGHVVLNHDGRRALLVSSHHTFAHVAYHRCLHGMEQMRIFRIIYGRRRKNSA
jgi:hypothetical protein